LPHGAGSDVIHNYTEDFTTARYSSSQHTTAWWDTLSGRLSLHPFEITAACSVSMPDMAYGVTICGDYAYVGAYSAGLRIIDISDPTNPTLAGFYDTPDNANNVAVAGDYAYVADWSSGLQVIDISDPTNPTYAGSYEVPGLSLGVTVWGDYAYLADHANSAQLQILDISDPTDPMPVASYTTPGSTRYVVISGDYAYVAEIDSGLEVVDISDPTNPTFAGRCTTPGMARGLDVSGDYAYIGDDLEGLQVIDISDPTNPVIIGSRVLPSYALRVAACGDYVYVADHAGGLQVVDVSDPANPRSAGSYHTPSHAHGIAVSGTHACVADWASGLQVLHVADPVQPPLLAGNCDTPGSANRICVEGDRAFVADGISGLTVIDITDPTEPVVVGTHDTPDDAQGIAIAGNYAYVADETSGLQIVNVTDPTSPSPATAYDTPGRARAVSIFGDFAYVADWTSGLQVVDIRDPLNPAPAGSLGTPGPAEDLLVSGEHIFVAAGHSGIQVIDISSPLSPALVGNHDTPGYAEEVVLAGDFAFVADGDSGLQVISVADPAGPVFAANFDTPGYACGVSVIGDFAFVADGDSGFIVIDISTPTSPAFFGAFDTQGSANGIEVSGDFAYVASGDAGIQTLKVFERRFNTPDNQARSEVVHESNEMFTSVRLTTFQTDSIRWEISADSGLHWENLLPDGVWHSFSNPGGCLMWRSTLSEPPAYVNPTCWQLEMEYWSEITSHVMDGELDPNSMLLCSAGLNLYVDYDGEYLYVATEGVGGTSGLDHFVLVGVDLAGSVQAPWSKTGTVAARTLCLGSEDSNGWCGWFDADDAALAYSVACTSGTYLEGMVRLDTYFGGLLGPHIYVAAAAYESPDGGALTAQTPAGDGDGDIEADEYAYLPLHAMDGRLDERAVCVASSDTFNLFADWDGEYLYVAAEGVSRTDGLDHIILCGLDLTSPVNAPWAKTGTVAERLIFLGNEDSNNWCGWYDENENGLSGLRAHSASGVYLEGLIRLEDHLVSVPPEGVYLALGAYQSPDSGALVGQAPSGNFDGNIDAPEYAYFSWGFSGTANHGLNDGVVPPPVLINVSPNPFVTQTRLVFSLPYREHISARVYNLRGRWIRTLAAGPYAAGTNAIVWDGRDQHGSPIAPGIYFINLRACGTATTRKVILLR
jgi:hypothetical protein